MLYRYFYVTEKWSKRREDKLVRNSVREVERPVKEQTGWISEYSMKGKKNDSKVSNG